MNESAAVTDNTASPANDRSAGWEPANMLERWRLAGVVATVVILLSVPLHIGVRAISGPRAAAPAAPLYIGSEACGECHAKEYGAWKGSNHALAMLAPHSDTVLADFNGTVFQENGKTWRFEKKGGGYYVRTDDTAGAPVEIQVAYTFGWFPLQQYLVPMAGGRLQCLSVAWDVPNKRWFSLYPNQAVPPTDWLHWTRPAMNWNTMCADCHSTGVRKRYDPETDTYKTTWAEIFVGCEACHGPGSLHAEWARKPAMGRPQVPGAALPVITSSMPQRDLVNLCAPCHSRRSQLRDQKKPGGELLDTYLPSLLSAGLFHPDGQIQDEDYEYHSFLQSKMFEKGVKCSDCHDVHRAKRYKEGNELCLRCHRADTYDAESHHFHKKFFKGKPSDGALCPSCHMPGQNYMVVHFRRDHSLRVPRPDLSASLGVPNACSQAACHADKPLQWVTENYDRWYGTKRKPHYGSIIADAQARSPDARVALLALVSDRMRPAIVRATALDMLWEYPGDDATKLFEQALADEYALVRRTAANRFPQTDPVLMIKNLAPLLKDPAMGIRIEVAQRLAEVPPGMLTESQTEAFKSAMAECRSSLAYTADMPSGRYNWGILEQSLNELGEAERQYRKALDIDSQFYMAAVNLAILLSGQGRNTEAETLLRQAVDANPHSAAAAFDLGLLLAEMGKKDEATAALRKALQADPTLAQAAYNLAVLVGETDPAEAAELCRRAAEQRPAEPRYAFARAYYQLRNGRERDAVATLNLLVNAHPSYGDAVLMLGELLEKHGRVKEAAEVYDRALATTGLPEAYRAQVAARRNALG